MGCMTQQAWPADQPVSFTCNAPCKNHMAGFKTQNNWIKVISHINAAEKGQTWKFNCKTASTVLCDLTVEAGTKTGRAGGFAPVGPPTEYSWRAQPWWMNPPSKILYFLVRCLKLLFSKFSFCALFCRGFYLLKLRQYFQHLCFTVFIKSMFLTTSIFCGFFFLVICNESLHST